MFSMFVATVALSLPAVNLQADRSGEPVRLSAMLILASRDGGPSDAKVKRFEGNLKRLFKFSSYRHYGEGTGTVTPPGKTRISLGRGFSLEIEVLGEKRNKIRAKVQWRRGRTLLINTTVAMEKGTPTVLGGPSHEKGTLIVVLTAR